jgi:hypothetical protein
MSQQRYRAWRFLLPGLDAADEFAGLTISPTGSFEMVEGYVSVRQAIMLLISTMPGERVMRPDYGCDLHKLIFSPNDATTAGLAIHYIRSALDRWEPRINVLRLDAHRNPNDPGRLDILLDYRLRATHRDDALAFSVNLAGEPN